MSEFSVVSMAGTGQPADRRTRSHLKLALLFVSLVLACCAGAAMAVVLLESGELPDVSVLEEYRPPTITRIHDRNGTTLGQFAMEKRNIVALDQIPRHFIDAVIAAEDTRFFHHNGLDLAGIMRAGVANLRAGRIVQGGSTLTQQLTKLLFLTPEKSFRRKLMEAIIAMRIERHYAKEEILALYCNQIYLGHNRYGVEAAARFYFGKPVQKLGLPEAALLAGLPQRPSAYSPIRHPEAAVKRRNHVLERMAVEGFITRAEAAEAQAAPLALGSEQNVAPADLAPHFVEEVRKSLAGRYGDERVYLEGLSVHTTLDPELQALASRALEQGLAALEARQSGRRDAAGEPERLEGALVAMDARSGQVLAMVGGRSFEESQFNCAVQAPRQPGSAFKPVYYAAAFGAGMTPADTLFDEPIEIEDAYTLEVYRPRNFSREFYGLTTLRRALEKSYNPVSVQLLQEIGYEAAIDYARRLGVSSGLRPYPSLALGVFEMTLLELTGAYQVFANQGIRCRPYYVEEIRDRDGKLLVANRPACQRVASEETAFLVTHTLRGVIERGTARSARDLELPLAGKTGTTDDYADAWFIGYSPRIVCGVWVGYPGERKSLGDRVTGAVAALPIWKDFMAEAVAREAPGEFRKPPNVVMVPVDARTGRRATPQCEVVIEEAFVRGTEPVLDCTDEMHALVALPWEYQRVVLGLPPLEEEEPAADTSPDEALLRPLAPVQL